MESRLTQHTVHFQNANKMSMLADESVHLVVTSPPYPMIEMWDDVFIKQSRKLSEDVIQNEPEKAFAYMHSVLDNIWKECYRILKPGCFLCINIGDATRNINNNFRLFSNHSHIVNFCTEKLGMYNLPGIIWSKPTNSPTKFLGSGVLPCGAYMTLEHENILIFKKPGKREFVTDEEKFTRRESSYFWEERNTWFSDIWNIKGAAQKIVSSNTRQRNASYPIEIPYRLINMFSCIGDTVVDPFYGLGTTSLAAMLSERNSIGFEVDNLLSDVIVSNIDNYNKDSLNWIISDRYTRHQTFMRNRRDDGKELKYYNERLKCSVVSSMETDIMLRYISNIEKIKTDKKKLSYLCRYNSRKSVYDSPNENALF